MADINKILLTSGLPGVEAHFKKQILENDKNWFRLFLIITIIYIGFWCTNFRSQEQYEKDVKQTSGMVADSLISVSEESIRQNDSLYQYMQDPFVSDTVSESSIWKLRSDQIKKHKN